MTVVRKYCVGILMQAVLLCVLVAVPNGAHAASFSIHPHTLHSLMASAHEAASDFWCGTMRFVTVPLGFCQKAEENVATSLPNHSSLLGQLNAPISSERSVVDETSPATISEHTAIATSVSESRIIRETPTYVTNEYITNPVTIIRGTVRSGGGSNIDTSSFVTRSLFDAQVDATHNSFSDSVSGLSDNISEELSTDLLTVSGNGTLSGTLDVTGALTTGAYLSAPYLTASDITATSTFRGALTVGTSTSHAALTLGGALFLASISPSQTASRLYNQNGSLYWAGNIVAGASVGTWDADGGNVYRLTGQVGIGTSTPQGMLHLVRPDITGTENVAIRFNRAGDFTTRHLDIASDNSFRISRTGIKDDFTIASSGAVGIGTSNPDGTLSVRGSGTGTSSAFVVEDATDTNIFTILDNGRVGIGTTSPDELLHIAGGSLSITGTIYDSVGENLNIGKNDDISFNLGQVFFDTSSGNVGIGTTTPESKLTVQTASTTEIARIRTINDASISLDTRVYGSADTGNVAGITRGNWANLAAYGPGLNGMIISNEHAVPLVFTSNATERMRISGTGNVGIGSSTPSRLLTVAGNTYTQGLEFTSATGTNLALGTTTSRGLLTVDGNIHVGAATTPAFFVDETVNRVGIGLTNPSKALEIADTGQGSGLISSHTFVGRHTAGSTYGMISHKDQISNTGFALRMSLAGSTDLNAASGQAINFYTDGFTSAGIIDSNQRWGVGTTTPSYDLTVAGDFFVGTSSEPMLYVDSLTGKIGLGTTSPDSLLHLEYYNPKITFTDTNTNADIFSVRVEERGMLFRSETDEAELLTLDNDGNVGIGTTSPQRKLHLGGNAGLLRLDGTDHAFIELFKDDLTTRDAHIGFPAGSSNRFSIATENDGTDITFNPNGNVGIGTINPSELLDVQGNVNIDGMVSGSAITQSSTDATSGRLTKVGDFGLGEVSSTFGVDGSASAIEDIAATSFFVHSSGSAPGDNPFSGSEQGAGIKIGGGSNWTATLWAGLGDNRWFGRAAPSSGPSSDWTEFYTEENISDIDATSQQTFSVDGDEKMRIDSNGNVGIGTTNPSEKLDVEGYVQYRNGGEVNSIGTNDSGHLEFYRNARVNNTVSMLIDDETGNIGIGTTSPNAKLTVAGDIRLLNSGVLQTAGGGDTDYNYIGQTAVDGLLATLTNSNDLYVRGDTQVRLGLNVGTPSYTASGGELSVAGNALFAGRVGIGSSTPGYDLTVNDQIAIRNPNGAAALTLRGGGANTNFIANSTTTNLLSVTGGTGFADGANYIVYGENAPTGAGDILLRYGSQNKDLSTADVHFQYQSTGPTFTTIAKFTTSDVQLVPSSGKVGVGTTVPRGKLTVAGAGNFSSSTSDFTGSALHVDTSNMASTSGQVGPGITFSQSWSDGAIGAAIAPYQASNDVNSTGLSFYVHGPVSADPLIRAMTIDQNGNVGIGTINPGRKLDVESTDPTLLQLTRTGSIANTNIQFTNDVGSVYAGAYSSDFAIGPNQNLSSSPWLYIDDGNVGIGTTTPASPLHVTGGSISVDTLGGLAVRNGDNTSILDFDFPDVSTANANIRFFRDTNTSGNPQFVIHAGDGSVNPDFTVNPQGGNTLLAQNGGNVGVGMTNPNYALDVTGDIRANVGGGDLIRMTRVNDAATLWVHSATAGGDAQMYFRTNTPNYWAIGGDGGAGDKFKIANGTTLRTATRLTIDGDGNVGIGTASPSYTLEVAGTGRFNSALRVGTTTGTVGGDNNLITTGASSAWLNVKGGSGRAKLTLGNDSFNIISGNSSGGIRFRTGASSSTDIGTEVMRLHQSGGLALGSAYASTDPGAGSFIASGSVGIGTTSPGAKLYVTGGSSDKTTALFDGGDTDAVPLVITGSSSITKFSVDNAAPSGTNNTTKFGLNQLTTTQSRTLFEFRTTWNDNADATRTSQTDFFTANNGSFESTMTLLDGNVGIGSTTPSRTLTIGSGDLFVGTSSAATLFADTSEDRVGIGTSDPERILDIVGERAVAQIRRYATSTNGNPATAEAGFLFKKARGTEDSPLVVQDGDGLGTMQSYGWDGDSFEPSSVIRGRVNGSVSDGIVPGSLVFETTNTSGTLTERMVVDAAGDVGIGTTTPLTKLHVEQSTNNKGGLGIFGASGSAPAVTSAITVNGSFTPNNGLYGLNLQPTLNSGTAFDFVGAYIKPIIPSGTNVNGTAAANLFLDTIDDSGGGTADRYSIYSASTDKSYFAGSVGVGTTTPSGVFDVSVNEGAGGYLSVNRNDGTQIWGQNRIDVPAALQVYGDNDNGQDDTIFEAFAVANPSLLDASGAVSRFVVKGNGNVGIGTTSPSAGLEIDKGATNDVALKLTSSGTGWGSGIRFNNTSGREYGIYSGSDGIFRFTDEASSSSRLVIDGTGNVGINTINPAALLDIKQAGDDVEAFVVRRNPDQYITMLTEGTAPAIRSRSSVTNAKPLVFHATTDESNTAPSAGANGFRFRVRGSNVMHIDESGNLGVGDMTPSYLLTVGDGDLFGVNSSGRVLAPDGAAGAPSYSFMNDTGTNTGFFLPAQNEIGISTNASERLRIDAGGKVGIGTSTPSRTLTIDSPYTIPVSVTSDNSVTMIGLSDASSSAPFAARIGSVGDELALYSNGNNERLRIDASGNVGIGETNPDEALHVNNGALRIDGGKTGSEAQGLILSDEDGYKNIQSYNNEPLALNALNNNVGIGTTTPSEKLTVAGTIQATNLQGGATNLTTDASGNIIRDPSDARLKTNVTEIDGALETVLQLRGVRYEWKDTERFGKQAEIGFVAQEVDLLVPEAVRKGGEYWSLNTRNMVAVVVEGFKDFYAEFETLRDKVAGFAKEITSDRIVAYNQFCIGNTCIDEADLRAMLKEADRKGDSQGTAEDNSSDNEEPTGGGSEDGGDGELQEDQDTTVTDDAFGEEGSTTSTTTAASSTQATTEDGLESDGSGEASNEEQTDAEETGSTTEETQDDSVSTEVDSNEEDTSDETEQDDAEGNADTSDESQDDSDSGEETSESTADETDGGEDSTDAGTEAESESIEEPAEG